MPKHLYIHIPFCHEICTYCDFYRSKTNDKKIIKKYIEKIVKEIKNDFNIYKTIYIGGGTPNFLDDTNLNYFLSSLKKNLDKNCEFTIECNPEFITQSQIDLLIKNKVNRVSIGIQSTNNNILKLLKRTHDFDTAIKAIKLLYKNKITNISCDFIYNLPLLKEKDILNTFKFIKDFQIPHISFYSLELKKGSILTKQNYKIDVNEEENQLEIIKQEFSKLNYIRYEISNWAKTNQYFSKHNLAYWNLCDWKGIGISSYGFENNIYYKVDGTILDWVKKEEKWNQKEINENIFLMGLRKTEGINLKIQRNYQAFNYLKNKINKNLVTIQNNHIKAKNIDLLNEILLDII
ncbi:MAG: radical SAM family heme chaperone HemW [Malacoplasma sp.]|nr:radical SAM family heme chaperone HemW [Malacoplasma sp.]